MANQANETTQEMIERMADEGGGAERNANETHPLVKRRDSPQNSSGKSLKKKTPHTISNLSEDPDSWEAHPEKLKSPVG